MKVLTNNQYYSDIADTIRQMKGVATTYKPREMAGALRDMYSTEVEGAPPLTFPSNGNNLLNYRIEGANGGVGDRTKNLANDNDMLLGYWAYADGTYIRTNTWVCTPKIACKGNVDYTFQFANNSRWYGFVWYDENNNFISTANQQNNLQTGFRSFTAKSPSNAGYLVINIAGYPGTNDTIRTDDLINFQLEESSTVTDYEPYGYKIPVVISGKNLLQNTATSQTISGVTFTVNSDGSVTCNGTASSNAIFAISVKLNANINYILNGTPENGGVGTYRIDLRTASYSVYNNIIDNGNGAIFTVGENGTYLVSIRIASNYNCNNLTFYPMIRLSSVDNDTYEPYIEPTTTNIYLNEPIGVNESKELSDTNVNIPTINGINTLSIDTTVQPSNVYVQAPKISGGGGIDFAYAKLEDVSTTKNGIIGKVTEIDLSNITFVHCVGLFSNATNLTNILNLNTEGSTSFNSAFSECSSLETLPNINTSNSTHFGSMCLNCTSLKNVPIFDMVKCETYNNSNIFSGCPLLTNESLNNILASLLTSKNIVSTNKTLAKIGLSETQATTCTTLSNWQALVDKGWTTGY